MKKLLFFLLIPLFCFSQQFGNTKIEQSTIYTKTTKYVNNKWYNNKDNTFYFKNYNITPIGIKNAISDARVILRENNIKFNETLADSSFLSSLVKDIDDYEMLNITIDSESSEVFMNWRISEYTYLTLSLKKGEYNISLNTIK